MKTTRVVLDWLATCLTQAFGLSLANSSALDAGTYHKPPSQQPTGAGCMDCESDGSISLGFP